MKRIGRNSLALLLAVLTAYALAAVAATQSVMARLAEMGVTVPVDVRISTTFSDLINMAGTLLPLLLIALGLGFAVAAIVSRRRPDWKKLGYPLAGFAAVITMYLLMRMVLELTPVAAARSIEGLLLQGVAGAVGGWVFYLLAAPKTSGGEAAAAVAS